nr:RNA-directed DNA polymerase, eukaryota [Tanacetum cinerariifolium]
MNFVFKVVKVVIHGEEYDVHIHELGSWSINLDHLSTNNSDFYSKVDVESKNEEYSENKGKWENCDEMFFMINIYGPQEKEENFLVWNHLLEFIRIHEGQFVLFGYINEVRHENERYGMMFSQVEAQMFNSFIDDASLLDLPLEDTFLDLKVTALPCGYSNHIPLMLHNKKVDYGPLPFKCFHSWLHRDGFEECIQAAYTGCSLEDTCLTFHEKLKLHPQIHQKHWMDPGDRGSMGRTSCSSRTDLNFKRFETYVKAKDLDLWLIILNGDFPPLAKNKVTQILEVVLFEEQSDDIKKKLAKNNRAKMVLYNPLPKKEYERIFMCKTAKDIWKSLLITHQEESIDSGFARFNNIITSLKALDKGFSSKNYVRKFIRALHPKWREKVTAIEELKDFSSLALDELIENLKVHEVVMEKDSKIYKGKKD